MTDLLTHVLTAYVLATVGTWQFSWLQTRHVPLAMLGGAIPDTAKVYLLLGSIRTTVFGVELSWLALQTVGAGLAFTVLGGLLVPPRERRQVLASLGGGVSLHIILDYFVVRAGGYAPPYLYPLTWAQLPAGNVYLSSDIWLSVVATILAASVWAINRRRLAS